MDARTVTFRRILKVGVFLTCLVASYVHASSIDSKQHFSSKEHSVVCNEDVAKKSIRKYFPNISFFGEPTVFQGKYLMFNSGIKDAIPIFYDCERNNMIFGFIFDLNHEDNVKDMVKKMLGER